MPPQKGVEEEVFAAFEVPSGKQPGLKWRNLKKKGWEISKKVKLGDEQDLFCIYQRGTDFTTKTIGERKGQDLAKGGEKKKYQAK